MPPHVPLIAPIPHPPSVYYSGLASNIHDLLSWTRRATPRKVDATITSLKLHSFFLNHLMNARGKHTPACMQRSLCPVVKSGWIPQPVGGLVSILTRSFVTASLILCSFAAEFSFSPTLLLCSGPRRSPWIGKLGSGRRAVYAVIGAMRCPHRSVVISSHTLHC